MDHLLGQAVVLQETFSVEFPKQSVPLYFGAGFVQDLERVVCPPPQDLVHGSKEPHDAQLPLTKIYLNYCL